MGDAHQPHRMTEKRRDVGEQGFYIQQGKNADRRAQSHYKKAKTTKEQ